MPNNYGNGGGYPSTTGNSSGGGRSNGPRKYATGGSKLSQRGRSAAPLCFWAIKAEAMSSHPYRSR